MIYYNALDLIGNTPILNLKQIGYPNLFVKLEKTNPGGSIKDRAALYMINGAEEKGILNKDSVLVEATIAILIIIPAIKPQVPKRPVNTSRINLINFNANVNSTLGWTKLERETIAIYKILWGINHPDWTA